MPEFSAKIYKVGINPAVDVPTQIATSFHKSGYIPVKGKLNQVATFRSTLCPTGGGNYRLYINAHMRSSAGVDVGKRLLVELVYDNEAKLQPMPNLLKQALAGNHNAQVRFDALTSARKNEILAYLNALNTKDSVGRNVKKLLRKLDSK